MKHLASLFLLTLCATAHGMPLLADSAQVYTRTVSTKHYELKDHLGNVRAVVSDVKEPVNATDHKQGFTAQLLSSSHYDAFGMELADRSYASATYRYGFNGKEKDDEWKGSGNSYDFDARIYDPRVGRWLTVDPLADKYAAFSPYNFCLNNPISFVDPDGKDVNINDSFKKSEMFTEVFETLSETTVYENLTVSFVSAYNGENMDFNIGYRFYDMNPNGHHSYFYDPGRKMKTAYQVNFNGNFLASTDLSAHIDGETYNGTFVAGLILQELVVANVYYSYTLAGKDIEKFKEYRPEFAALGDIKSTDDIKKYMGEYLASDNVRQLIIKGMKQFEKKANYDFSHTSEFYNAISFYGLTDTDEFKDLKPEVQKRYMEILKIVQNGQTKLDKRIYRRVEKTMSPAAYEYLLKNYIIMNSPSYESVFSGLGKRKIEDKSLKK